MINNLQHTTEDPHYNDSVRYQRFCCKIELAVIKKPNTCMDPSKALITDTFEHTFLKFICLVFGEAILTISKTYVFLKNNTGLSTKIYTIR